MKLFLCPVSVGLVVLGLLVGAGKAEEVRPLEFLHALQDKDYHDVAVEYLKALKQQSPMPEEVAEVWDLEMSKSLRGAAKSAFDRREAEQLTTEAQKYLDKFLKEKPEHPEAISALLSWSMFSMERGLDQLRLAKALGDKEKQQKAKHLAEARTVFEEARPRFQEAAERFHTRLASLPPAPPPGKRITPKQDKAAKAAISLRDRLERALINAEFQAAVVEYYIAQTYDIPKDDAARKAALKKAAKAFDNIYQKNRVDAQNRVSEIGLTAHMWHGKVADELGDLQLAKDIYEEVLANEVDPKIEDKVFDPLFAQVRQFSFAIQAREKPAQFLEEATEWLKLYERKSKRYEGYQGVALEVAKTLLKMAAQSPGPEGDRMTREAVAILGNMQKVPSPYQQEAFALRRQFAKGAVTDPTVAKGFDEAVSLARTAADAEQWADAVTGYTKALELSGNVKDEARLTEVRNALAYARLRVAEELLRANKLEECLQAVGPIVQKEKEAPVAPAAASIAASAALGLYAAVPASDPVKKQAALSRLHQIVDLTEANWPGKPEADDGRMALGKASLLERKFDDAIGVFEKVNSKSERYPVAIYLAGYAYWQRYLLAKRGEEKLDEAQIAADRAKAVERARASLAEIKKRPEVKNLARQQVDSSLLLAEMALEANQAREAVSYVQPLLDTAKSLRTVAGDNSAFRVFYYATRAFLAMGDVERASGTGMALADLSPDNPQVNYVLVDFAKLLDGERQNADADVTKATAAGDAAALQAAKGRLASAQQMMGSLLKKLASRKQHTLEGMMSIAELCRVSGLNAEADAQYRAVLAAAAALETSAGSDKKAVARARAATTRARAQRIGLLRAEGKFDEAYTEVRKLMDDNKNALEPKLEFGRILQAWAEKDPRHYDEAVKQWVSVRNLLQPMRKKPPEYYEVIYNAAFCLAMQAEHFPPDEAEAKRTQAYQLLKSALILNEKLDGPAMVAKYNALMKKLEGAMRAGAAPKKR